MCSLQNLSPAEISLLETIKLGDFYKTKELLENKIDPVSGYYINEDEVNEEYVCSLSLAVKLERADILEFLLPFIYEKANLTHGKYFANIGIMEDALKYVIEAKDKEKERILLNCAIKHGLLFHMEEEYRSLQNF